MVLQAPERSRLRLRCGNGAHRQLSTRFLFSKLTPHNKLILHMVDLLILDHLWEGGWGSNRHILALWLGLYFGELRMEEGEGQQYCLKWNNYQVCRKNRQLLAQIWFDKDVLQESLSSTFSDLLASDTFVDVTLSCEGQQVLILIDCLFHCSALGSHKKGKIWEKVQLTVSRGSFWSQSIKKWSDITSLLILNDNITCFMAFLDIFSTKNGYQKNKKLGLPNPAPPPLTEDFFLNLTNKSELRASLYRWTPILLRQWKHTNFCSRHVLHTSDGSFLNYLQASTQLFFSGSSWPLGCQVNFFFRDISHSNLVGILEFIYNGEVSIEQDCLPGFLAVAETLRIRGLTGEVG